MAASAMSGRLTLCDPLVKELAQASCVHEKYYDALPKLQGEANWQGWSDALQHAALMAGTDGVLNGESKHPKSLEGKQCTTAEWNDNIKRTAIWRSRNESLLKAMRGAADSDLNNLGASNAHDTYVNLRSRYHTSDNQRAFGLFSEDLIVNYEPDIPPEEIADQFQNAFNQYNQLVGDNIEQRLPENFLKMAFLDSLASSYDDWRRALLRERNVLALGQVSTLTFNELVELAVVEHNQLLQDQTKDPILTSAPVPLAQQAPKRDISHVDEASQQALHRPCSLPHHSSGKHTNQTCETQNPRLRKLNWTATKEDQMFLTEHPEIENPQVSIIPEISNPPELDPHRPCSLRHHQSAKHTDQTCKTQNPALRRPNWKPNKEDLKYLEKHPAVEPPQLSNTSRAEGSSQPRLHERCSLPHHPNGKHTNETCKTQNPRMRPEKWKPSKADQIYLAEHPEIENSQLSNSSLNKSENGLGSGSRDISESDSESKDNGRQTTSASGQNNTSASGRNGTSRGQDDNNEYPGQRPTVDEAWARFAAARYGEVQAQIDLVTRAVGGSQNLSKGHNKDAPLLENISGKWLLYDKEHISGTADNYHIQFWETTTKRQRQTHPKYQQYQGRLIVGPHELSEPFVIANVLPPSRVTGRSISMHFRRLGGKSYEGKVTFWGNGKMFVTLPSSVLNLPDCNVPQFKFAGLRSSLVGDPRNAGTQASTGSFADNTDPEAGVGIHSHPAETLKHNGRVEATAGYDRVIRTERSTSVAVKVEQEDSDMIMSDNDQDSTAIAIKSEAFKSSDSDDELADDAATIIDMVQRQKDSLRGGLVAPLQDLPGIWSFHSPDYKQDFGQGIQISFYDRVDHDLAERMCAPGHCKPSTDQIRYCGELRFKAKEGERDWSCLIKQFVVPKQASVAPVKIQSWDPLSKRIIFITAWFLGGGAMSMSIPTTYIPNYQGQKTLLTFSGVKRG